METCHEHASHNGMGHCSAADCKGRWAGSRRADGPAHWKGIFDRRDSTVRVHGPRVMRQGKARLAAGRGAIQHAVNFFDAWHAPPSTRSIARNWTAACAAGCAVLVRDGRRRQSALRADLGKVRPLPAVTRRSRPLAPAASRARQPLATAPAGLGDRTSRRAATSPSAASRSAPSRAAGAVDSARGLRHHSPTRASAWRIRSSVTKRPARRTCSSTGPAAAIEPICRARTIKPIVPRAPMPMPGRNSRVTVVEDGLAFRVVEGHREHGALPVPKVPDQDLRRCRWCGDDLQPGRPPDLEEHGIGRSSALTSRSTASGTIISGTPARSKSRCPAFASRIKGEALTILRTGVATIRVPPRVPRR